MKNLKNYIIAAFFTVIIAISAIITISIPFLSVPLTLQTFGVALTGFILKKKYAVLSVLVYILIGLIGLPVFSGFGGGPAVLLGQNGGFIMGFLFLAFFCGLGQKKSILKGIIGLILCHVTGIIWFSFIFKTHILSSFILCSLPYLPKDIISVAAAFLISRRLTNITQNP